MSGFTNIKDNELPILARSVQSGYTDEDGKVYPPRSVADTLSALEAIDDMLSIRRMKMFLVRKRGYQQSLGNRLADLTEELKANQNHLS